MPKNAVEPKPMRLSPKGESRRERERRTNQLLVIGTGVVLGLVVLILGWGLLDQYVLMPRRPVATVAGEAIPLSTFVRHLQYRRFIYHDYLLQLEQSRLDYSSSEEDQSFILQYLDQQITTLESQLLSLPNTVLDELIDDKLVRQEAARRGITVSQEEIDIAMEEAFGYYRNPPTPVAEEPTPVIAVTETETATDATPAPTETITDITPTPTLTPAPTSTPMPTPTPLTEEAYIQRSTEWFQTTEKQTGFTKEDFRTLVESSLLREKLEEAIGAEVPTTAEQVHARHILLETREEAEAALERLKNGEAFEALAAELSQDTMTKEDGGDLGWFPRGQMVAEFEEAAFALQPGELSEIVETSYGFHIIRVEEREDNRPLEDYALQQARSTAVNDWFMTQRATQTIENNLDKFEIPKDPWAR